MANVDRPFGFRLRKNSGKTIHATKYAKTAGTAIYPGDLVKLIAAGTVSKFAQGDGKAHGVCAEYAAAAATEVFVYDDPTNLYEVQITTYAAADVGQNSDIHATDTPDTDLRQSGNELDAAQNNTTIGLPVKILGLAPNQEIGANANVLVQLNNTVRGHDGSTGI